MKTTTIIEPPTRCVTVTPSDSADLNVSHGIPYARMLRVTADGDLSVVTLGGDQRDYTGLTAGTKVDWVSVRRVRATGTTATVEAIY